jgi:molybdopterin molybdotransferase
VLTTAAALERILEAMPAWPAEITKLGDAVGRTLRQPVVAERDQPPFDRVMMDGIAIAHADYAKGQRSFAIQSTQMAGQPADRLDPRCCIEIMTGAALPKGADCIVPVERIAVTDGEACLEEDYAIKERQFIHPRASDYAAGAELLAPGRRVSPMDVAVIASAGLAEVATTQPPVVRIISTGDELVPPGQAIAAHQVRNSNGPALVAMLASHGYHDALHDHLVDEPRLLEDRIAAHIEAAEVLVLSGGVSMGKADYVPEVLARLGVEIVFHKISQRPGKPMWFGLAPGGKPVFALPGNPVSALVCCRHYVIPALDAASGMAAPLPEFASLAGDLTFEPDLTCFQPVRLISNAAAQVLAMPVRTNTSGDFAALSGSDGYVELSREQSNFPTGTPVRVFRW